MRLLIALTVAAAGSLAVAETPKVTKVAKPAPPRKRALPTPPPAPVASPEPIDASEGEYVDLVEVHRKALPAAPSNPKLYDAWKQRLTVAQRRQVERFCRVDRPADYEPHCGGIGIHRIPSPPRLTRVGVTEAQHATWKASLTRVQRATYDQLCALEENAYSELCGGTPLVVAFDSPVVAFTPASAGFATDWPTATTPWLALDRDGDGAITPGAELFGDTTVLPDGRTARHGFEALAALDGNGDGRLDRADPLFASLVLWADRDGDRVSSPAELTPAARSIEAIELRFTEEARCDARLNCQRETSVMHYRDAAGAPRTGAIVDVYLHRR